MAAVARVGTPEGWAVLSSRGIPVPAATGFLRYLDSIERSPNTIKAYASDLALFFTYLEQSSTAWSAVTNEVLARFIKFARTPSAELVRTSNPGGGRSAATVNRYLAAVSTYARFLHESSNDPVYATLLRTARTRRATFTERQSTLTTVGPRLRSAETELRLLTEQQVLDITDACSNLRDKLLVSMLHETGMRIGQLLLLRHSDIRVPESSIWVRHHEGDDELAARNKSTKKAEVPVSPGLIQLYAAYMSIEYKVVDSDFVFVNLWAGTIGQPMTYHSIEKLVGRLRRRTDLFDWSVHSFRHYFVTRMLNAGVSMKTVSYLVTHASVATTADIYDHVTVEDVRQELISKGIWGHA